MELETGADADPCGNCSLEPPQDISDAWSGNCLLFSCRDAWQLLSTKDNGATPLISRAWDIGMPDAFVSGVSIDAHDGGSEICAMIFSGAPLACFTFIQVIGELSEAFALGVEITFEFAIG